MSGATALLRLALALLIAAQSNGVPQSLKTEAIQVANEAIAAAQADLADPVQMAEITPSPEPLSGASLPTTIPSNEAVPVVISPPTKPLPSCTIAAQVSERDANGNPHWVQLTWSIQNSSSAVVEFPQSIGGVPPEVIAGDTVRITWESKQPTDLAAYPTLDVLMSTTTLGYPYYSYYKMIVDDGVQCSAKTTQ